MTQHTITLGRRFRGPELSGNGGYTAGRLAAALLASGAPAGGPADHGPVTVTLRQPPPLDEAMTVEPLDEGSGLALMDGENVVATATPGAFASGTVAAVDFETATAARAAYRGAAGHPFPGCFVCGPARAPGDGLRLAPGLIGPGRTACVWVPDPALLLAGESEHTLHSTVGPEFAWAALDCPGGWTSDIDNRPLVLGRMTAYCATPPQVGRPHVVVGQLLHEEGRKTFTSTCLYDRDRLVGRAEHVWIAVDPAAFNG